MCGGSGGSGSGGRSGGGGGSAPDAVINVITVHMESQSHPGSFIGETKFIQRGTGEWTQYLENTGGWNKIGGTAPKLEGFWRPTLKDAMEDSFGRRANRYTVKK
jgi:hypothetical protein